MPIFQLIVYGALLFFLCTFLAVLPGLLIARLLGVKGPLFPAAAFGFGVYALDLYVVTLVALGVSNFQARLAIIIFVVTCLWLCVYIRVYRQLAGLTPIAVSFFLYYLFCLLFASYPSGMPARVTGENVMSLFALPVDNFIPYNWARLVVSRIDPASREIVPTWVATDRGPLSGIFAAALMMLVGVEEHAPWMSSSADAYFVFEASAVYLNGLAFALVLLLSGEYYNRRARFCAGALYVSNYFFLKNTVFGWPKLLAAYALIGGFALARDPRSSIAAGLMLACALLAHDSAFFYLVPLGIIVLWKLARKRELRLPILRGIAAFVVAMCPWWLFKMTFKGPLSRLVYLSLFCAKREDLTRMDFFSALQDYLTHNSLTEIASVRTQNLVYPFDLSWLGAELIEAWNDPGRIMRHVAAMSFYQLALSVNFIVFVGAVLAIFKALKERRMELIFPAAICVGALGCAAVMLACPFQTVTHAWGIPAAIFIAICAGGALSCDRRSAALGCLALTLNLAVFYYGMQLEKRGVPLPLPEATFLAAELTLFSWLLVSLRPPTSREDPSLP